MAVESELEGRNGAPNSTSFMAFFMRYDHVKSAQHDRGGKKINHAAQAPYKVLNIK